VLSRLLRTIREHDLVVAGDRVLLAVSGGPDSTALLHGMHKLTSRLGVVLHVACVDHRLRPESALEAQGVAQMCADLGLSCDILAVDVHRGRRGLGSSQEAARRVRLAALESAADRRGCTRIALGHTADDQAETVLFRIVRGTGIAGLSGIAYRRGRLIRPLLDVRRREILAYLAKRKIGYFSDPSNANQRYARSRIRHRFLPALAEENPRVVDALLALARDAQGPPDAAWRAAIPPGTYLPRSTIVLLDRLVREGQGTRRIAVRGGQVVVGYGKVSWLPMSQGTRAIQAPKGSQPTSMSIHEPGRYPVPWSADGAIELSVHARAPIRIPEEARAVFDAEVVRWPLTLRSGRAGDRMRPRGGRGSKKLSDLLIDGKIPRDRRGLLPVLCDAAGTILFVPGLRPSETGRPNDRTRDWLEVRLAR
jgi:tRNA(Ile)-lysidine synthase